jgi:hypothetical protein
MILIYTHPQATLQQREQAGAYISLWWIGHAAGAAGLVFSGYGDVIEIGRKTLEALEAVTTQYRRYQDSSLHQEMSPRLSVNQFPGGPIRTK